tara:strand:- start:241 stop:516 length:276 start_codon:yes stop_codon:yes gene_type:complete
MDFIWIVLEKVTTPQQQVYWDYDEEGNPIPGTEIIFDYIMVYTLVEYDFPTYQTKVTVEINHYNPQTEEDIETGIYNRGITEEKKLANTEQ